MLQFSDVLGFKYDTFRALTAEVNSDSGWEQTKES